MLCKARGFTFITDSFLDPNLEIFRRFYFRKRSARDDFDQTIKILSIASLQY
jgi:hypothetical protein